MDSETRLLTFGPDDQYVHVVKKMHGNTYQIVATVPDAFSPLMGTFLIRSGITWFRMAQEVRKDALGRPKTKTLSVAINVYKDEPVKSPFKLL